MEKEALIKDSPLIVKTLILASGSPFRQKLMDSTGISYSVISPQVDEYAIQGESPQDTGRLRCLAKGQAVASQVREALVISCDQTLGLGDKAFDKPQSPEQAMVQLEELQGQVHHLFSSHALFYSDAHGKITLLQTSLSQAPMRMRSLNAKEIATYVATGEWNGCVGGYRCEGKGAHLFLGDENGLQCDQSVIIGLPLTLLLRQLRALGLDGLLHPEGPWQLS